jgi:MYXO-CTERM domain-containing protein
MARAFSGRMPRRGMRAMRPVNADPEDRPGGDVSAIARTVTTTLAVAALLCGAPLALASPTYFSTQCAGCHDATSVGSTATTCNGCHAHGTHPDSTKSSIYVAGATDAASYAPGATVKVTITGGYRTGWLRAVLYDQSGKELARSTGPNGMGGGAGYPVTLTAPAPATPGSYTWSVGWYGNQYDASGARFGARWTPDPTNPNHGYEIVSMAAFTVAAASAPAVALAPASVNFGNVDVGSTGSQQVQLQNTGTATLTVSSVARCTTPATSTELGFAAPATPFTVAPGASVALTATYAPTAAGADTGCLAVRSDASNAPTTNLAVTGTGVVPAAPQIAVSPTSLSFGNVTVGATSAKSFTVSNTGTAPLTGTVALASGTSAEYTVSPASFNVAAGASQTVTVTYAPADTTSDAGSIVVASNDPTTPAASVAVTAAGVAAPAPSIALAPATLAFGTVTVGGSASLTTQVQNGGTAPLSVTSIAPCAGTSTEFSASPVAAFTVAAGGSTTVTVTYRPTGAGADTGCLVFTSNDAAHPTTNLAVSGSGQPAAAPKIAVSPTSLTFGNVTLGASSSKTFSISNPGTATLTGTVARASGTSAEYAVSPATFTVAAGGSQTITVSYAPVDTTTDGGSLVVSSDDAATPTVSVALSGAGVAAPAPSIALAPNALSFGTVTVGSAGSLTAQVRNTGSAALQVTGLAACTGTSAEFAWSPAGPLAVAPGQSVTLTVTYTPTAVGVDSGCIAISSNDAASPVVNLGLSGTGAAQAIPAIALDPGSLDFGTVTVGSTAAKTTLVRNAGTGPLQVTGVTPCAGTPARYTVSPAGPFSVAAGQSATLTVTYAPTAAATDAGCLAIASDDPAHATVNLAVSGVGAQPPVPSADADLDIVELELPARVDPTQTRSIVPKMEVVNRSAVDGSGTATLVGVRGGAEVYRQTIPLAIPAGARREVQFPAFAVPMGAPDVVAWTATVEDQDPDVDRATASTYLRTGSWSDDRAERERELLAGASGSAGGCSTGNGNGSAWAAALSLLAVATLRRRRRAAPASAKRRPPHAS